MNSENARRHREEAKNLLSNQEYLKAGEKFTLSAYAEMGVSKYEYSAFWTPMGLRMLLMSGICYRTGNEERRCENRCRQGILITEDLREYETGHDAEVGIMYEFDGDFRLIGGIGDWKNSYNEACEAYSRCDNPLGWNGEPSFSSNIKFLRDLVEASGKEIDFDNSLWQEITNTSFTARIEYKRKNLQDIIDEITEDGWQNESYAD